MLPAAGPGIQVTDFSSWSEIRSGRPFDSTKRTRIRQPKQPEIKLAWFLATSPEDAVDWVVTKSRPLVT